MNFLPLAHLEDYQRGDLRALEGLFSEHDPRGLEQMIAEDHYVEVVVERASDPWENGSQEIRFDRYTATVLDMPDGKRVCQGDTVRFYQEGEGLLGGRRHGFAVNGEVIEWQTPWERFAKRMAMLAGFDRRRREEFKRGKTDIDRWYALLRGPYKARIDRLRAAAPDFDLQGGTYEIYPVLMAQRIEHYVRHQGSSEAPLGPHELIESFRALAHEDQAEVIHGGEPDTYGISGYQFDCACAMAAHVLAGREI